MKIHLVGLGREIVQREATDGGDGSETEPMTEGDGISEDQC